MTNLLSTIQQNRAALAGQPAANTDETQKVEALLRAKSGKAAGAGDTAISNLGEQAAIAQTASQMGQIGQKAQVQTQQENVAAAGVQQQEQQQRQAVDMARKFDTVQNRLQTQSVLNNLAMGKDTLDSDRKQAGLEQAAFLLSMQDKQYTDTLQDIGRRRRLDDAAAFRNEIQEVAFGESLAFLRQKLGQKDLIKASERDFQKMLSDLSIEDAMQMAAIESRDLKATASFQEQEMKDAVALQAKAANQQATYKGVADITSTSLAAYGTLSKPGASPQIAGATATKPKS